eukprot:TRINITY_DN27453_c1_g1_i1.p1 TRINITY_DN27453_c1_g1~~TRINITY_DN27453_c1_g1_i1.p1  ORF type:complete len:300 (+),score=46.49 TRINITY_DN27453_c1_g1_i1:1277-2176(+)
MGSDERFPDPSYLGRPPLFFLCIFFLNFCTYIFLCAFLPSVDSLVNQIPQSLLRDEDLKKAVAYHSPPELKGWGQAAHILLQYERSHDIFLAVPSWHEPLESDRQLTRRKVSAVRTPKPSNRSSTFSAQSSVSPHSPEPSPLAEEPASDSKHSVKIKRSYQLTAPSSASSSSYSKDPLVLNIFNSSSSSLESNNPSAIMSKHKAKNLLDNLSNLPAPGVSKTSISDPSSMLGKQPTADTSLRRYSKAKDELPTKSSGDSDPLSKWLEDPKPPLPPQHSPSSGWKSSSGPSRDVQPVLGE